MSGVPQLGKKKQPRSDVTEEPEPQKTDEHVDKKESGLTEKGQEIKSSVKGSHNLRLLK